MSKAEEVTSQVRQLVLAGRKIEAVKLFRDNTWSSLLDAKLAVEALAEGRSLEKDIDWLDELYRAMEQGDFQASVDLLSRHTPLDRLTAEKQIRQLFGQYAAESVAPVNDPELNQKIEVLIRAGKKIEAVKLYKDQTKLGLAESKLAVEQIEQVLIRNATDVSDEKRNSMLGEASSPSSNLHRFARTLAFLYALICLVAIAFIIGLSLGQPVSVNPCKVSQDLPADAQLVELLKWKNANIPSTTGNFFLEDRFLDYRIEPGCQPRTRFKMNHGIKS